METKQAPLPPNGTRNRYMVEGRNWAPTITCWYAIPDGNSYAPLAIADARELAMYTRMDNVRITTRLADGRKLVIR